MYSLHNSNPWKNHKQSQKTNRYCHDVIFLLNYPFFLLSWCNMIFFGYTYNANNLHIIFLCQIKLVWWQQKQCIKMKDDALYLRKRREKETPLQYFIGKLDLRGKRGPTTRKKKRLLVAIFCVIDFFCCSILVNVLGRRFAAFLYYATKAFFCLVKGWRKKPRHELNSQHHHHKVG